MKRDRQTRKLSVNHFSLFLSLSLSVLFLFWIHSHLGIISFLVLNESERKIQLYQLNECTLLQELGYYSIHVDRIFFFYLDCTLYVWMNTVCLDRKEVVCSDIKGRKEEYKDWMKSLQEEKRKFIQVRVGFNVSSKKKSKGTILFLPFLECILPRLHPSFIPASSGVQLLSNAIHFWIDFSVYSSLELSHSIPPPFKIKQQYQRMDDIQVHRPDLDPSSSWDDNPCMYRAIQGVWEKTESCGWKILPFNSLSGSQRLLAVWEEKYTWISSSDSKDPFHSCPALSFLSHEFSSKHK